MSDPRFPIGKFQFPETVSEADIAAYIDDIAAAPAQLRAAVEGLNDEQLDTPYRDGGWTVRQVVHHVPDSHMNSYVRFKLAATEENPRITTYEEQLWAELPDGKSLPVEVSLRLLELLHERWVVFLRALTPEQLERTFVHPSLGQVTLKRNLALYAWHGRHHVAHVTSLRAAKGLVGAGLGMSKAFTKDNDDAPEEGVVRVNELPLTAKNYVTPRGFEALTSELRDLADVERPEVVRQLNAATGASRELEIQPLKRRQREIEGRISYLTERIRMAEIIDPAKRAKTDRVFFGATVVFANRKSERRTVRIVGVDEMDIAKGYITFVSPLAKALLGAHEGDTVPFQAPGGKDELEILEVRYGASGPE